MNKQQVEIVGRVVIKPELLKSKAQKNYSKVRVAVNRKNKDKNGKQEETVTYYDILVFGKQAEKSIKLEKGKLVRVLGNLEVRPYKTKKGEPKVNLTVLSNEFYVFDTEVFK